MTLFKHTKLYGFVVERVSSSHPANLLDEGIPYWDDAS